MRVDNVPLLHKTIIVIQSNWEKRGTPHLLIYAPQYDTADGRHWTRDFSAKCFYPFDASDVFLVLGKKDTDEALLAMPLSKPEILVEIDSKVACQEAL